MHVLEAKICIDYFQLYGLFSCDFPPFRQTRIFLIISYTCKGKVHFHQNFLLEDINIDHSDNSNHQQDNVSREYVDIPYPQTNESSSLVETAPQQEYAPANQQCKTERVYRSITPSFIVKSTRFI